MRLTCGVAVHTCIVRLNDGISKGRIECSLHADLLNLRNYEA